MHAVVLIVKTVQNLWHLHFHPKILSWKQGLKQSFSKFRTKSCKHSLVSFSYQVQVLLADSGQTKATPSTGLQSTKWICFFKKSGLKKIPGLNTHMWIIYSIYVYIYIFFYHLQGEICINYFQTAGGLWDQRGHNAKSSTPGGATTQTSKFQSHLRTMQVKVFHSMWSIIIILELFFSLS